MCKAAWPHLLKQKYGRVSQFAQPVLSVSRKLKTIFKIINTASLVGMHGAFGQANYSAAKAAIAGFTKTLAIEGAKYNIIANTILPTAGTQLTATSAQTSEKVRRTLTAV